MEKNTDKLELIISLLEEQKKDVSDFDEINKIKNTYDEALKKIDADIYELTNYTNLLINNVIDKNFSNLIQTLNTLKDNPFVTLTDSQKDEIRKKELFISLVNGLSKNHNDLALKYDEMSDLNNYNNSINSLISMLKQCDNLIENDLLKNIYDVILNDNFDYSARSKIRRLILEYNISVYQNKKENIRTITIKEKMTDEELTKIFSDFGFNYSIVTDELKQKLRVRGEKERIVEVLETLKKYNIPFKEDNIINICYLLKSSREAIEQALELSKLYGFDFYDAIRRFPSIIMHKNRGEKGPKTGQHIIDISGSFEEFKDNLKLIESLGYDIKDATKSSMSVLTQPNSRLRTSVNALRQYGFPENLAQIGFKLSGLTGGHVTTIIDKFIELGELEYIKNNASRLILDKESFIFYRLYFAKKKGGYEIKRKYKDKEIFTGIITKQNDSKESNLKLPDSLDMTECVLDKTTDEKIKSFIEEAEKDGFAYEISNSELLKEFDKTYKSSNITYDLNGITISRLKVLRIFTLLEKNFPELDKDIILLYATTYASILDEDEFKNVKNIILKEKTK